VQGTKDHRSCCTGTHDFLPSPHSVEAWALIQSSLRAFWVWDRSKVGSWQNDWLKPIHRAPTQEKRRPSDKWLVQASGLWWRGPVPTQTLRPVSNPWSCPVWESRSETHHFLLLWCPVLAHYQQQKQCTVRNWVTEVGLRSTEWSRQWCTRKWIFCVKQWGHCLMASDWSFCTVCFLEHFLLASDPRSLRLEGILFLVDCQDQIPVSSYSL
jgi:hypothetical protein